LVKGTKASFPPWQGGTKGGSPYDQAWTPHYGSDGPVITRILFESNWLLLIVWVPVQFVLIAVWFRLRTRVTARIVWIGFTALPVLAVTSTLVETRREQVVAACHELAAYVCRANLPALDRRIAAEFQADELDREAFLTRLEQALARHRVADVSMRGFGVTFPDRDRAVAEFHAAAYVQSADLPYDRLTSRWRLTFRREGDRWLLTALEPRPTGPLDPRRLQDWLR